MLSQAQPVHKMAATPESPAVMKAMSSSSATKDDTPKFPGVMDDTPEFPVVIVTKPELQVGMSVACDDLKAFPRHLRLASSLGDPPLRSVRAAGIPKLPPEKIVNMSRVFIQSLNLSA